MVGHQIVLKIVICVADTWLKFEITSNRKQLSFEDGETVEKKHKLDITRPTCIDKRVLVQNNEVGMRRRIHLKNGCIKYNSKIALNYV